MPANKTNRQDDGETAEASILVYDTENCTNIIKCWGVYDQNALEVVRHHQIITVSWRWLGRVPKGLARSGALSLPDFPLYKKDPDNNRELMRVIHGLMQKADIVCGHNAFEFDNKRVNSDLIKHGFTPPPPFKTIDTLRVARNNFGFNQNSLKALAAFLGLPRKLDTGGYELWRQCDAGNLKAWKKMTRYCAGDTRTLEALYLKIRPWDHAHPALRPRNGVECPLCASKNLQNRGHIINRTGRVPRYQCQDCGRWSSGILSGRGKNRKWVVR